MRIPGIRDYVIEKLENMLNPRTVAVVGASRNPEKIGYQIVRNLLESGYKGKIYPINPKAKEILGLKCYPSVKDVPDDIDLVVISVPASLVKSVVKDCAEKGVGGIAIITSGFSEVGNKEEEDEIVRIAREKKIPILGPNIVGILNSNNRMNASFAPKLPFSGKIALISQSGALIIGLIGWTYLYRIGLSKVISIGNKADIDFSELITYFVEKDPNTAAIAVYMEGTDAGPEFIEACKRAVGKKPIIVLKAGFSKRGEIATMSHTGSMAGSARIYKAAFRQSYVITAEDLFDLYDKSLALSLQPPAMSDNIIVITNGGGAGVIATDAAERYGIPLTDTPKDLAEKLRKYMPPFGSTKNPVDLTGQADENSYYNAIVETAKHENIGGIVVIYCHTAITDPTKIAIRIAEASKLTRDKKIPIVATFIGGQEVEDAANWLKEQGIPVYPAPTRAMRVMAALREYGRMIKKAEMRKK